MPPRSRYALKAGGIIYGGERGARTARQEYMQMASKAGRTSAISQARFRARPYEAPFVMGGGGAAAGIAGARVDNNKGKLGATNFIRQMKALVEAKHRDATDVTRATGAQAATTISCLTSSTDFATAASGTGLLDMDGDSAQINSVHITQSLYNVGIENVNPINDGASECFVRTILVWFFKPLLVASAAGTLPPITEVLVADLLPSLVVPDTQNAGRFTVLYDKTDRLGTNTLSVAASGSNPRINGVNTIHRDFIVKINKQIKFKANSQSGVAAAQQGGHYDSDVPGGQTDRGLLVMYTQVEGTGFAGALNVSNITRLNYTG